MIVNEQAQKQVSTTSHITSATSGFTIQRVALRQYCLLSIRLPAALSWPLFFHSFIQYSVCRVPFFPETLQSGSRHGSIGFLFASSRLRQTRYISWLKIMQSLIERASGVEPVSVEYHSFYLLTRFHLEWCKSYCNLYNFGSKLVACISIIISKCGVTLCIRVSK